MVAILRLHLHRHQLLRRRPGRHSRYPFPTTPSLHRAAR